MIFGKNSFGNVLFDFRRGRLVSTHKRALPPSILLKKIRKKQEKKVVFTEQYQWITLVSISWMLK